MNTVSFIKKYWVTIKGFISLIYCRIPQMHFDFIIVWEYETLTHLASGLKEAGTDR